MSVPLTIETFEFEKLRAKVPEMKMGGEHNYYSIPFEHEENKALIRIHGNFRVFKHKKSSSYSLGIRVNDEKEEFFESLGERITKLSCNFKTYPKPSHLELIKANADGKYTNVYIPTRLERQKHRYRKESKSKESLKRRELTSMNLLMNRSRVLV